ncbi:hypothetical protein FO519_004734 [Halicephalobus sp. NKZ332]|nr:hypothetical protein FO519_004734 [Halicephalobus sp. NKZ332]
MKVSFAVIVLFFISIESTALKFDDEYFKLIKKNFQESQAIQGPISSDFNAFLSSNGYDDYDFARTDLGTIGSYGGKKSSQDQIAYTPIVFVHGNSDGALTDGSKYGTGWTSSITYFLSQGYTPAELYATTWGDRNKTNAYLRTHNCNTISRIRMFLEAVLYYSNADQINVISHSMGVAIARKAIRGGIIEGDDGVCELGPSMRARIKVFIGISGANYGMCQCTGGNKTAIYPTCNKKNGFWPGEPCELTNLISPQDLCGSPVTACSRNSYSQLLQEMNEDPYNEAQHVFSYWSYGDDLISYHDSVFGRPTSFVPFSNASRVFRDLDHMATKDKTPNIQNGYGDYDFARKDLNPTGSYGGKNSPQDQIVHTPIVFVHGNSDGALMNDTEYGTGWTSSIAYFLSQGYTPAELYATTWGDRVKTHAYSRTHNYTTIRRIRTFFEAVLQYSNADQINVISHSMGVVIARKAIRGGIIETEHGDFDLGPSLRAKIKVFIGISGANYGICQCAGGDEVAINPTCNKKDGFWPGEPCELTNLTSPQELCGSPTPICSRNSYSQLLQEMNEDPYNEAQHVFSYWSYDDKVISYNNSVFGRPTSLIPFSNASMVLRDLDHMATKDETPNIQYKLVTTYGF